MNDVTQLLAKIESGDGKAASELMPLVYAELRKLAAASMSGERTDHTLQATALVHEAYVRLVDKKVAQHWNSRGHFFCAAAEAMRRILVENARRKLNDKYGGQWVRTDLDLGDLLAADRSPDPLLVISVHEALERLAERSPRKVELVKLRYFAGLTLKEAAEMLGISPATAEDDWTYVRAWLRREWLRDQSAEKNREK
jgi:RNA polymerase sigma factor (TIGR02999 family)